MVHLINKEIMQELKDRGGKASSFVAEGAKDLQHKKGKIGVEYNHDLGLLNREGTDLSNGQGKERSFDPKKADLVLSRAEGRLADEARNDKMEMELKGYQGRA